MPDYCYNDIRVQGPASEMETFIQTTILNQPGNEFNPESITNSKNWGSRFSQGDVTTRRSDVDLIELCIDSAGRPPLGLFRHASKIHPRLVFSVLYKMDAGDFGGLSVFKGGKCLYEDEVEGLIQTWEGEIPVVLDDDDQWVQADTMEPIPGVSQEDVECGIISMNPLSFDDFDVEEHLSGSNEEDKEEDDDEDDFDAEECLSESNEEDKEGEGEKEEDEDDFDVAEYLSELEEEEEEDQLPFNGVEITPIQLIGDNNPFSLINGNVVCFVCFNRPYEPVASKCYHVFCSQCIQQWTDMYKTNCPNCNQEL